MSINNAIYLCNFGFYTQNMLCQYFSSLSEEVQTQLVLFIFCTCNKYLHKMEKTIFIFIKTLKYKAHLQLFFTFFFTILSKVLHVQQFYFFQIVSLRSVKNIHTDMMIFFLNEIPQKQETVNEFTVEMNYKYFDFKGLHKEVETCCLT